MQPNHENNSPPTMYVEEARARPFSSIISFTTNTIKNVIKAKEYTYIHTYIHTLHSYIIYGISIVDIITADEMPCPRGWSAVPPRESINGEQLNIFMSSVLVSSRAYSGSDA